MAKTQTTNFLKMPEVEHNTDGDETFPEANDSCDQAVGCEGTVSVPDNELENEIRIFDFDSESDPAHRTGVQLQEGRPVLHSDSGSEDATITCDTLSSFFSFFLFFFLLFFLCSPAISLGITIFG